MKMRMLLLGLLLSSLVLAPAATSTSVRSQHTEATLISDYASLQPNQQWLSIFLRLKMDPGWHTYWLNPGDSGIPTTITWKLPDGFTADEIKWPPPQLISDPPLLSYGYTNVVWLATDIHAPGNFKVGQKITIQAHVTWLECRETCIPAKADLTIEFPIEKKSRMETDSTLSNEISAAAKSAFHFDIPNQRNEASYDSKSIHFVIKDFWGEEGFDSPNPAHPADSLQSVRYIPEEPGQIMDASQPTFERKGRDLIVNVARNPDTEHLPEAYQGILRFSFTDGKKSWTEDIYSAGPLKPEPAPVSPPVSQPAKAGLIPIVFALLAAFGGGLILNLMPCVLPVLSLKVLAMVEQARKENRSSLTHGFAFTAGVLLTFLVLAGSLLVLQGAGRHLGWGFQLQNPKIVVLLASLFFFIGLNLFGVFEIGTSLTSLQLKGSGLLQSFFSGLLATIVATPCTAPFMGSALGFALNQPGWIALLVFAFLGLGMAAPYLCLSASPGLLRFVPRPGAWMETFKQMMGFPMMASVIWLIWVFSHQAGLDATISFLMGLLLMAIAAWLFGRFGSIERPSGTRIVAAGVAICLVVAGLTISLPPRPEIGGTVREAHWEKFDPQRLEQLRQAGTPVFVDFTATWCLTCQVNKRVALNIAPVLERFHDKGVVLMEADWTNEDPAISSALNQLHRDSVPVYALYGKEKDSPPQLLPEILTPQIVLQALDKIP